MPITLEMPDAPAELLEPIRRLSKDLRNAADLLNRREARYLVDCYYQLQDFRIQMAAQIRASGEDEEPNALLEWLFDSMRILETGAQASLGRFANQWRVGRWLRSICGIGPVISAGLLAHLDIRRAPYAGNFWSFAGLSNAEWKPKTKRPWNADLKCLCWKIGESFIKVQNNQKDFYGKVFVHRKAFEIAENLKGENKDAAVTKLEKYRIGKETNAYKAYSEGRLPDAHVNARARRYAVKLFLSHVHHVMYEDFHGIAPPQPYSFGIAGHGQRDASYIAPPDWPGEHSGRSLEEMFTEE